MMDGTDLDARLQARRDWYASLAEPPLEPTDPKTKDVADTLRRDGVVIIPGFMARDRANALATRLFDTVDKVIDGTMTVQGKVHRFPEFGLYRFLSAETLDPELASYFKDPFIEAVAKNYTCRNIVSWQRMLEWRDAIPKLGSSDLYHLDEGFYFKFKAFLYLTDVSEETAPYAYLKGSHRAAAWRKPKELQMLRWETDGEDAVFGQRGNFFEEREIDYLTKKLDYEPIQCTGPAGTLVLTDTCGIHKATTPISGGRLMLGHYYELPRKQAAS